MDQIAIIIVTSALSKKLNADVTIFYPVSVNLSLTYDMVHP